VNYPSTVIFLTSASPGEAFKNSTSRAVEDENTIVIPDHDQMYREIEEYFGQREVLLAGHDDPGTFL